MFQAQPFFFSLKGIRHGKKTFHTLFASCWGTAEPFASWVLWASPINHFSHFRQRKLLAQVRKSRQQVTQIPWTVFLTITVTKLWSSSGEEIATALLSVFAWMSQTNTQQGAGSSAASAQPAVRLQFLLTPVQAPSPRCLAGCWQDGVGLGRGREGWGVCGVYEPFLRDGAAGLSKVSSRCHRQLWAAGRAHASLVAPFDAWIRSSLGPANSNTSSEIGSNWWWATSGLWNENSKTFDWVQVKWIFIICSVNFCQDEWYSDSILIISEVDSLLFSSIWKEQTANTWRIYCSVREEFCSSFQIHPWHFAEWNGALRGSPIQHRNTELGVKRGIRLV